jgi:hypothetical protein
MASRIKLSNIVLGVAGVLAVKWMVDQAWRGEEEKKILGRIPPIEAKEAGLSSPPGDSWKRKGPLVAPHRR